jgi:hypothetical protein
MPKVKISEYSTTNSANTDIESINIDEGCAPSGINNAIRELMVHLKEFQTGSSGDPLTVAGTFVASGGATLSGTNTLSGSTVMTASAGTSASPSIHFSSDTNTGIFSPAADTIAFAEGGVEAMRIDSSGNVGIGTTSPSYKVDIQGSTTGSLRAQVRNTNSGTGATSYFTLGNDTDNSVGGLILGSSANTTYGANTLAVYQSANAPLTFWTNNNERMRIDSSGNVGIGTTTAVGKTTIRNSAIDQVALTLTHDSVSALNWNFVSGVSGEAHEVFELRSGTNKWLRLFGVSGANHAAFYTANTERARITSGGYFLAGTTSVIDGHSFKALGTTSADYAASFQQNGSGSSARLLRWLTPSSSDAGGYFVYATGNAGANTLNIFSNGNITNTNGSYGTISDIKHKQDIVDARSQWNDIKNIKIRKFRFKNDSTGLLQIGVIAQELEQVSPGLVSEHKDLKEIEVPVLDDNGEPVLNEDGTAQVTKKSVETEETTKSVKTTVLYMKAVKALQEAMARIETLEAQNAAFEARLAALEAK